MGDAVGRAYGAQARRAVGLLGLLGVFACEGPPVDARAVWIDAERDAQGRRTVHIYDRGRIEERKLARLETDPPRLFMELGPRGRSLLVLGDPQEAGALWLDLSDGRTLPLPVPGVLPEDSRVAIVPGDDAVLWWTDAGLELVPVEAGLDLEFDDEGLVRPLHRDAQSNGWVRGARGGPRLFLFDPGAPSLAWLRYPDMPGDAVELDEPATLRPAPHTLQGVNQAAVRTCLASGLGGCGARMVVAPSGDALTIVGEADGKLSGECPLIRWAPADQGSIDCEGAFECDTGGLCACLSAQICEAVPTGLLGTRLLAALDHSTYILLDAGREALVRWEVGSEDFERYPILGAGPYAWSKTGDGQAITFLSQDGGMVRVDLEGLLDYEPVNATSTTCLALDNKPPVFSPDGRWAAWTCASLDEQLSSGTVLRVSARGLERFDGVPMVPIAIDNQGDVLLYSEEINQDDPNGIAARVPPRTLFTLSADGTLHRTDSLEPTPEPINLFEVEDARYFLARPSR